jgi:hypothetical protein
MAGDERTAWYRREPILSALTLHSIFTAILAFIGNFIRPISRDFSIHEENGTFLLVFEVIQDTVCIENEGFRFWSQLGPLFFAA